MHTPALSFHTFAFNLYTLCQADEDPQHQDSKTLDDKELYEGLYPNLVWNEEGINYNGIHRWAYLWGDNTRIEAVKEALKKTGENFRFYLKALENTHLLAYESYLDERFKNKEASIDNTTVSFIQDFYNATSYFVQAASISRYRKVKAFSKDFFFDCFKFSPDIKRFYHEIDLRAQLGFHLPYRLMMEISKGNDPLVEKESWENFISNVHRAKVSPRILHRGLKAIVEHAFRHKTLADKPGELPNLSRLEYQMQKTWENLNLSGSPLLTRDPEHIQWRNTLVPGKILISKSYKQDQQSTIVTIHKIVLGEQIGATEKEFDRNVFFEIQEYHIGEKILGQAEIENPFEELPQLTKQDDVEKLLFWVGRNEAVIGINQIRIPDFHIDPQLDDFFPLPKVKHIDPEGKFALIEKLHTPWGGHRWIDECLYEDADYKETVIEFIKILNQNQKLIFPLNPKYFAYNYDGELCSTRVVSWTNAYDLFSLEEFIYNVSMKDFDAFQELMNSAKVLETEEAKILRNIAATSFNEQDFTTGLHNIQKLSDIDNDRKGNLFDSAKKLKEKLLNVRTDCFRKIEAKLNNNLSDEQKKNIEALIISNYQKTCAVTLLPPSFEDEIVQRFAKNKD